MTPKNRTDRALDHIYNAMDWMGMARADVCQGKNIIADTELQRLLEELLQAEAVLLGEE